MNNEQPQAAASPTRQIVAFSVRDEEYAVAIDEVREVVKAPDITPVPGSQKAIVGVMNLRGKIVPVLDLELLFDLRRPDHKDPTTSYVMVTEDTKNNLFGIRVDYVSEVIKITDEMIKPAPSTINERIAAEYVKGVVIQPSKTPDGAERMLLQLSLQKIVSQEAAKQKKTT